MACGPLTADCGCVITRVLLYSLSPRPWVFDYSHKDPISVQGHARGLSLGLEQPLSGDAVLPAVLCTPGPSHTPVPGAPGGLTVSPRDQVAESKGKRMV